MGQVDLIRGKLDSFFYLRGKTVVPKEYHYCELPLGGKRPYSSAQQIN